MFIKDVKHMETIKTKFRTVIIFGIGGREMGSRKST